MKNKILKMALISIFLVTNVLCLAQNHGRVTIGKMVDDRAEITIDFDRLTTSWENVLSQGGVEINFTIVDIVVDEADNYLLMGTNDSHSIEACIALALVNDTFYEQLTDQGGGLTVSCKGCATGCHPTIKNGVGYCLPLCTGDKCEKTETLNSGAIIN